MSDFDPSLLTINYDAPRPSVAEVNHALARATLTPVALPGPGVARFRARIAESHSNGGVLLAAFHLEPDAILDWHLCRNDLGSHNFLARLLRNPAVGRALPELQVPDDAASSLELQHDHAFKFAGELAAILHFGGAYAHRQGDGADAHRLATELCDELFDLRFAQVIYFVSRTAWTDWFYDVAWDATYLLFDKARRRLILCAVTDTD